jgi:hypothetical protein
MASNPDIPLDAFKFRQKGLGSLFRREPQPKAIGHNGHAADPAEPKRYEPQQALRQRQRILLLGHQ